MVTPRAALRGTLGALQAAGCPDADYDAARLVQHVLRTDVDLRLLDAPLTPEQEEQLAALTARRVAREPLQYILGEWGFLGLTLTVGPGVLCPRPDSEVVCQTAIELLAGVRDPLVADLCAGSGCLGLGIQKFRPDARVTCVEKYADAFAYLQANTKGTPVRAVRADVLTWHAEQPENRFDLLISNPPYLTAAEMGRLMPETAREPAQALDGGADGLDFYRALLRDYRRVLRPGGWLVLEIGAAQGPAVLALARQNGWTNTACKPDYAGHDRVIICQKAAKTI